MLRGNLVITDKRSNEPLGIDGFENILDADDFLNVNLYFLTLDRLLDLCIFTNGIAVFPPIGEYALALELIQNTERFKRLREKIGKLNGKFSNTYIGVNAVDGRSGFFPDLQTLHASVPLHRGRLHDLKCRI